MNHFFSGSAASIELYRWFYIGTDLSELTIALFFALLLFLIETPNKG
jgi:hypothetical protein